MYISSILYKCFKNFLKKKKNFPAINNKFIQRVNVKNALKHLIHYTRGAFNAKDKKKIREKYNEIQHYICLLT